MSVISTIWGKCMNLIIFMKKLVNWCPIKKKKLKAYCVNKLGILKLVSDIVSIMLMEARLGDDGNDSMEDY